jgi:hypothetical protein
MMRHVLALFLVAVVCVANGQGAFDLFVLWFCVAARV